MIISVLILSAVKTSLKINNGHQESICNDTWHGERKYTNDSSTVSRFAYIHKTTNNKSYHSSTTNHEEFRLKGRHKHPTENINEPLTSFLLQNKINSIFLNNGLATKTHDVMKTVEKLENLSKLLRSNCKIALKPIVELIRIGINTTISRLKSDWNTLNDSFVQEICEIRRVIEEVSNVQHVLYKLIEIFSTVGYKIDAIMRDDIQQLDEDIYSLFKKLFLERFSVHESFENFEILGGIITYFFQVSGNQLAEV